MPKQNTKTSRPDAVEAGVSGTQAIERALRALKHIGWRNGPPPHLADVAKHMNVSRPTAYRILKALETFDLIQCDPKTKRFTLGYGAFELGQLARPAFPMPELARKEMELIAEATRDWVVLTVRLGNETVIADRAEGDFPISQRRGEIGYRRPLGAGAGGLALLAHLDAAEVNDVLAANAAQYRSLFGVQVEDVHVLVAQTRRRGYAINEKLIARGLKSVGVAILDESSRPVAGLAVSSIAERLPKSREAEIVAALKTSATRISKALAQRARGRQEI